MAETESNRDCDHNTLEEALRFLAGRCNWASTRDGMGFNRADAEFGHKLADWIDGGRSLTEKQYAAAYRMCAKYHRQLETPVEEGGAGIRWDAISKPGQSTPAAPRTPLGAPSAPAPQLFATGHSDGIWLTYPKQLQDVYAAVKALPERTFTYDGGPHWLVKPSPRNVAPLRALTLRFGFQLDDVAARILTEWEAGAKSLPSSRRIELVGGELHLYTEGRNPALLDDIHNLLPMARWAGKEDVTKLYWKMKLTNAALAALHPFLAKYPDFKVPDSLTDQAVELARQADVLALTSGAIDTGERVEIPGFQRTLRPFQHNGVLYGYRSRRCMLCEDVGLGKTTEAVAITELAQAYPAVVVCTASVKIQFSREIRTMLPARRIVVIDGTGKGKGKSAPDLAGADYVVINYDILKYHLKALIALGPKMIVLDESQKIKNPKSGRSKACRELAKATQAPFRLCLTGTPVENGRPCELIAQLQFLDRFEEIGTNWRHYVVTYCDGKETRYGWDISGRSNTVELNERLRRTCLLRRRKQDAAPDLPVLQRVIVPMALEPGDRKAYEDAEEHLLEWIHQEVQADDEGLFDWVVDALHRGMPAVCHYTQQDAAYWVQVPLDAVRNYVDAMLTDQSHARNLKWYRAQALKRAEQMVRIERLKQQAAQSKLAGAFDWLDTFMESGEPVLIFAHHQEIIRQVAERYSFPTIEGGQSAKARQAVIDRFQAGEVQGLVLNLQAGGEGINLQHASNVVYIEYAWTPAMMIQATARAHRMGQENPVTEWWLVAVDTIEEDICDLIQSKMAGLVQVTDGGDTPTDDTMISEVIDRLTARGRGEGQKD